MKRVEFGKKEVTVFRKESHRVWKEIPVFILLERRGNRKEVTERST